VVYTEYSKAKPIQKGYLLQVFREVTTMEVLKVSAKSSPNSVDGALAGVLREEGG